MSVPGWPGRRDLGLTLPVKYTRVVDVDIKNSQERPPTVPDTACSQPAHAGHRLLQGRFDDFDHVREAISGWDLNWRQLDGGALSADILQILSGTTSLGRVRFSRKFDQRGSSPPGLRTFGLLGRGVAGVRWCTQEVADEDILCFPSSGEYESVSQPGFAANTLSFPEERLATVAETLGLPNGLQLPGASQQAARPNGAAADAVRHRLHRVYAEASKRPSALSSSGLRHELEFEIPAALLSALASSQGHSRRRPPSRARTAGLRRAIAFIEDNAHEAVTIEQVCRAARVSWRTLNYAFREHFGVTPKQYLKAVRLNAVRRALYFAGPTAKITDVANRWGFWHMGQFAADYRKHFGELPSDRLLPRRQSPLHG